MKRRQGVLGVLLVVVLIGVGVGLLWFKQHRDREDAIEALLTAARIELDRKTPDRGSARLVLRNIAASEHADEARLLRAVARLQLSLANYPQAWDKIRELVEVADPHAEDLWIAARVQFRWHGLSGQDAALDRALQYARGHHDATGNLASLFLAWQAASRRGHNQDRDELAKALVNDHAATREGRFIAALARQGGPKLDDLVALEAEFEDGLPAELDFHIARQQLATGEAVALAMDRIKRVLSAYPSDIDARNLAAIAYHHARDRSLRDQHLRWLLDNAPPDDRRRPAWKQMLAVDVRGQGR